MKFEIKDNQVVIASYPSKETILKHNGEITIYSIIRRYKERRGKSRPIGDNCPMLYAMKGAEGLTTDIETIDAVYEYAKKLIDEYPFEEHIEQPFDVIILMPSKHSIGRNLACLLQQKFNINIIDNFLRKKTPETLIDDVRSDNTIPPDKKQSLITALQRSEGVLSIKDIAPKNRCYLHIFCGDHVKLPADAKHVLLVDDISSSGTTFESAAAVIRQYCKQVEMISAVTLFAPIK